MFSKPTPKTTLSQRVSTDSLARIDALVNLLNAKNQLVNPADQVKKSNLLDLILTLKSDEEIAKFLEMRQPLAAGLTKNFGHFAAKNQQAAEVKDQVKAAVDESLESLKVGLSEFIRREVVLAVSQATAQIKQDFDL